MKPASLYRCEVCGAPHKGDGWFLVTEDQDRNTLQILKWNSRMAEQAGVRRLCSAAHVEELVSHWMVAGSLDYERSRPEYAQFPHPPADDLDASYRLGELILDRSSFAALGERPDMLISILDAIDGALQASSSVNSLLDQEEQEGGEEEEEEEAAPVYDA